MELHHLRYFVAVAEELHFGRAARRLGMAQPPLSRQIRSLEAELGARLLERTKRHVAMTPAGAVLLEEARRLLAQADRVVDAVHRAARGKTGRLAVGFVGSATYGLLPEILRRFHRRFPEVALTLAEMGSPLQLRALGERRIDVGFLRPAALDATLVGHIVQREPLLVALPAGHRLAKVEGLTLADLASEPFVMFPREPRPSYGELLIGYCVAAGFSPRVAQETNEMQTAMSLVAAGIGVTLVPASVRSVRRANVVYKPLGDPGPTTELTMVHRKEDDSAALGAFLKVTDDVAAARKTSTSDEHET
jgi:DNA-binding transcriptional LysR family regulator